MTDVRQCTFDDLASAAEFDVLCAAYAQESGRMPEFGEPDVNGSAYRAMEAAGIAQCIGAWNGDVLVGFGVVSLSVLPHYSKLIGCLISFFVAPHARSGGTGSLIRDLAEQIAARRGAVGLMISAPTESRLDTILPRIGYRATNRLYFKALP
jgi:GNAT superfamily N-acetyltransferase